MSMSLTAVTITSLFLESLLYGVFLVLFIISVFFTLRRRGKSGMVNTFSLVAVFAMFVLATMHIVASLVRALTAFVNDNNNPDNYLFILNGQMDAIRSMTYGLQTLVGDGLMLYRLYVVWHDEKRVFIPVFLCFLANIGVGISALLNIARVSLAELFASKVFSLMVWFFALTLSINVACTSLIAIRIWWSDWQVRKHGASTPRNGAFAIAVIIVESGALYSLCLIVIISFFLSRSFAQFILLDSITPIVGIIFSLLSICVNSEYFTKVRYNKETLALSPFRSEPGVDGHFDADDTRREPHGTRPHQIITTQALAQVGNVALHREECLEARVKSTEILDMSNNDSVNVSTQ